jgi:hypothetical protein
MSAIRARVRNQIKSGLSSKPSLFIPAFRMFGPRDKQDLLIADDTEIVIEGYPRSANTFSTVAFQQAQSRPVRIAHHLHSEAQILRGVERDLPVVALIRSPVAAVKSLQVIFRFNNENESLRRWKDFYTSVDRVRDKVVIADFETITRDYGEIQRAVNVCYGTHFGIFDHTQDNVDAVYNEIEAIDRRLRGGSEMYVARPSEEKRKAQQETKFNFDPGLVREVEDLYTALMSPKAAG